jgi:hypothetical protein
MDGRHIALGVQATERIENVASWHKISVFQPVASQFSDWNTATDFS